MFIDGKTLFFFYLTFTSICFHSCLLLDFGVFEAVFESLVLKQFTLQLKQNWDLPSKQYMYFGVAKGWLIRKKVHSTDFLFQYIYFLPFSWQSCSLHFNDVAIVQTFTVLQGTVAFIWLYQNMKLKHQIGIWELSQELIRPIK